MRLQISCNTCHTHPCGMGSAGVDGHGGQSATLQDAAAFSLAGPAPDAVVDAIDQGVLEADLLDRASGADLAGPVDADSIAWEEFAGRTVRTVPL